MSAARDKNVDKLKAIQAEGSARDDSSAIAALYRHELRASHGTDAKADELVKAATKQLRRLFAGEEKYDKAADLLTQAGAAYKLNENWSEAGDALVQAAEIQERRLKNSVEAAVLYASAAVAYRFLDVEKALATLKLAVALHMENGRHMSAARVYEDMAQMQQEEGQQDEALDSLEQAANCFESEDKNANAVQVYLKLAAAYQERSEWSKAGDVWEKAGRVSATSSINKGSVHEYYFSALLCFFAQSAQHYSTDLPRAKYADYVAENRRYESSRQFKMIRDCMERFEAEDIKGFTRVVFDYNKLRELDEPSSKCLLKIKQALKAGPPEHVAASAAEQAGDSDYT